MVSLIWKQIKTLIIRNYLLTIRKKGQTAQMILFPIYFVVLLVVLKVAAYKPTSFQKLNNTKELNFNNLADNSTALNHIYIAPNFAGVNEFVQSLKTHQILNNASFTIFPDQASMDKRYLDNAQTNPIGILFVNSSIYQYALRFPYINLPGSSFYDTSLFNCRSDFLVPPCPSNQYLTSGFSILQFIIDSILIQRNNSQYQLPTITLQKMPKPGGIFNAEAFTIVSAIYLVFAMSPFMIILLVNVVAEKQAKIKEAMKVMGLSSLALWSSWSLFYGAILLAMVIVMSLIAVYGTLFSNSSFIVIFLLFLLYGLSIEMMGFMLTPFFVNARTAGTAGGFLNFFLGLIYLIVAFVPNLPVGAIWALNLFAPTGFAIAVGEIALMEVSGIGSDFSNLWSGRYPVGITFVMLTVDIFLYFFLTLYFDHVIPGEYGRRQPFYFPLQPSFWFPSKQTEQPPPSQNHGFSDEDFEPVPEDLRSKDAIKFSGITKIYKSGNIFSSNSTSTTAVNNFSLDIYEGQITALLGHNGAGKTTLFNILTGFIDTTAGRATVFNLDIANTSDLEKVRQMTGFCPQHNILFDLLSVKEHLKIFAGIKGIPDNDVNQEVERIVALIGLQDQVDTYSKKLSGGQKRKLSVGIAIMGDPKVLILDEPTAGMDPYSRHTLWNLLRERKEGRVILLTTHFMDEADILADRKAIVSRGKLRCVGSSLFLKNRFGIGYHLGVVTKTTADHSALTNLVKEHVTGAELQRCSGFEIGYTLPITQVDRFAGLFRDFETKGEELDIQSFGVSMTTLEEVFLKIGEDDEVEKETDEDRPNEMLTSNNSILHRLRSPSSSHFESPAAATSLNEDAVEVTMNGKVKFNPAIGKVGKPSAPDTFLAYIKILMLNALRSPGFIFFSFVFPLGLAIGGAAVLNISASSENTNDPPFISLSGAPVVDYRLMLYKNSTGGSIDDFVRNSPIPLVNNNLTDLLPSPYPYYYLASDIYQFERNQVSYRAFYNTSGTHSLPMIFNSMSQAALKFVTNSSSSSILTFNKRWPAIKEVLSFNGGIFGGVLMSAFAVIMTTVSPAIFPVYEREKKVKSQLRVSGVSFPLYWGSHFLIAIISYLIIAIGFFVGIIAFDVKELTSGGAIAALVLLFIGSGMSSILTSFCGSFMFDKVETISSVYFNIVELVTFLPYMIVSLLDQLGSASAALALNVVFAILIPYYTLFSGLYYVSKVYTKRVLTQQTGLIPASVYFDWSEPMVPFSILVAYLHIGIVFILLRVIDVRANGGNLESVFFGESKSNSIGHMAPLIVDNEAFEEDEDVKEERAKVNKIISQRKVNEPVVVLQNLRKEFAKDSSKSCFKRKKMEEKIKVAVANLSLSVHRGEVLGLLGPNGAGKTTAMSSITADVAPTRGQVYVSGHNIESNVSEAFQEMGYCSQDNPLWEEITLKEHLELFAVAHGVDKKTIKKTIDNYVDALDIREHLNKRSKTLSGGTKRKLCFAMAMLGNPQVVLLDEPSTGMDPKTKRFMWDTISTAFEGSNRGAVLTTHYMEEADALCSRVAIMVLGQLRCIGSTQHLKNKFGQGYVLEVKMKNIQTGSDSILKEFIQKLFANVPEPEVFSNRYVYKIGQKEVTSLSKVFSSLQEAKDELGIEEYSFSQSTLEQVFLQFAKEQDEREAEELA